jgi:hypothetical protein
LEFDVETFNKIGQLSRGPQKMGVIRPINRTDDKAFVEKNEIEAREMQKIMTKRK